MMRTVDELTAIFGLDRDKIQVSVGEAGGWGWADVLLAQCVPAGDNPYDYCAYAAISGEWPEACADAENGVPGAESRVRNLMAMFRDAIA
jgi:hypothetical protein